METISITTIRTCKTCKDVLVQREHESGPRFRAKKYCSSKCAREDFKVSNRGWYATKGSQLSTADEIAGRQAFKQLRGGDYY